MATLPATLWRRIGAVSYDLLIIIALSLATTMIAMAINQYHAIAPGNRALQISLVAVCCGYFIASWHLSGQTIGMRAWNIRLLDGTGYNVSWSRACWRLIAAFVCLLTIGLGWCWLDRLSGCVITQTH